MGNVKPGLVSLGLWLEVLNFFISQNTSVMNFANTLLHQHDLHQSRGDTIPSEMSFRMNCVAYSPRNVLAYFVPLSVSASARKRWESSENSNHVHHDLVQDGIKMWSGSKTAVQSSLILRHSSTMYMHWLVFTLWHFLDSGMIVFDISMGEKTNNQK